MTDLPYRNQRRLPNLVAVIVLAVAILVVVTGFTLANYRFAASNAGGNDFIPRWLGTRLLLTQGQNPYSDETSLAIQEFIYGRPAKVNEDQVLFVYPLYATLLFAPFSLTGDYALARAMWMTALEIALLILAFLSLRLANWRPSLPVVAFTLIFALTWYHSVRPLINGNPSILMALFVTSALLAIRAGKDVAGGALLAMSTIKPQAVILFLPLVLIWAYSRGRHRLIASALVSLGALVLLATIIEPAWLWQNANQVLSYPDYTLAGTPGAIFALWLPAAGRWLGIILTLVLVGLLIWQWKVAWKRSFSVLLPVAFFTLAATNLIGITTAASNYIALFPGLVLLLAYWSHGGRRLRDWPAVSALVTLLIGLWWLFWISRSDRAQSPVMFFPLPLLLIITMPFLTRFATSDATRDTASRSPRN